ncbi:MAG: hypothetical protein HPY74_16195 [Firmicutes bacterium]|nr:hypothetical protein [Bacillota bacterium]
MGGTRDLSPCPKSGEEYDIKIDGEIEIYNILYGFYYTVGTGSDYGYIMCE